MIRKLLSSVVSCDPVTAWHLLRGFDDMSSWHPAVASCVIGSGHGARERVVTMRDGLSFAEVLDATSDQHWRQVLRITRAPFPARIMKQTLTIHEVTATSATLLCWEFQADLPRAWHARARDWFCDGYIRAGLHGLSAHLCASRHEL